MLLDVSFSFSAFFTDWVVCPEKKSMVIFNFNTITTVWKYSTYVCLVNWKPLLNWIIAYKLLQIVLHSPSPQSWSRLMRKIHFLALVTKHDRCFCIFEVFVVLREEKKVKKDELMRISFIFCCFMLVYTAWNWDHSHICSECGKIVKSLSLVATHN